MKSTIKVSRHEAVVIAPMESLVGVGISLTNINPDQLAVTHSVVIPYESLGALLFAMEQAAEVLELRREQAQERAAA